MTLKTRRHILRGLQQQHSPRVKQRTCGHRLGPLGPEGARQSCHLPTCARCGRYDAAELLWDTMGRTEHLSSMVMLTLTVRTTSGEPLSACWSAVEDVWTSSRLGPYLKRHKWSWLRLPEVTYSIQEGSWHPHFHVLLFHESPDEAALRRQIITMKSNWIAAAAALGITASPYQQNHQFVRDRIEDRARVIDYAVKPLGLYLGADAAQADADLGIHHDPADDWGPEAVYDPVGVTPAFLGVLADVRHHDLARSLYLEVIEHPGLTSRGGVLRGSPRRKKAASVSATSATTGPVNE